MDKIDQALFQAWMNVGERCRRDRREALRRSQRFRRASVSAPVRQWCLCLRASDTRIHDGNAIIEATVPLGLDCDTESIVPQQMQHMVTIDGAAIGKLTRPVRIPPPGIPLWKAQHLLGMSGDYLRHWVRKGWLVVRREDCNIHGRRGKPSPIVYTMQPIDPQMPGGKEPDSVWGSLWMWKCEALDETFVMQAERVPRYRPWRGQTVFRGWDWLCPGRFNRDGTRNTCGRLCSYLFMPLLPFTLAKSICEFALEMPEGSGLSGTWHPGMQFEGKCYGPRSFACKHCWGVRNPSMLKHVGWNEFVTYISGGLLYGHEVERPEDEAPYVRKHCYSRRRSRKKNVEASESIIQNLEYRDDAMTA